MSFASHAYLSPCYIIVLPNTGTVHNNRCYMQSSDDWSTSYTNPRAIQMPSPSWVNVLQSPPLSSPVVLNTASLPNLSWSYAERDSSPIPVISDSPQTVSGPRTCLYCTGQPRAWSYSEQQNHSTKGQISLVSQIAAQRTKVNSWENCMTKIDILPTDIPSYRSLVPAIGLI